MEVGKNSVQDGCKLPSMQDLFFWSSAPRVSLGDSRWVRLATAPNLRIPLSLFLIGLHVDLQSPVLCPRPICPFVPTSNPPIRSQTNLLA
jgi:hypothetical protein